jgi:dihydroorotate dehydrogenase (NAD+) catalytic subunit
MSVAMQQNSSLASDLAGLRLASPLVVVSGIYGPDYADLVPGLPGVGAVITKTITLEPRAGNPEPRVAETRAGIINAIGLMNPGVDGFLAREMPKYRDLGVPTIASIAGRTVEDYLACAELLAPVDTVRGIELNVSCPNVKNGVMFGSDACMLEELVGRVKAVMGGKPLIAKLTPNVTDIALTARAAVNGGADALSLINTVHGMRIDIARQTPVLGNRVGGYSGPGIHPIAVYMVHRAYTAVCREHGIPILGVGGVATAEDALELLLVGAACVGVGTAMFRDPNACDTIARGITAYLDARCESSVAALIGKATV